MAVASVSVNRVRAVTRSFRVEALARRVPVRHRFRLGLLVGIALVLGARAFINATTVADWLVSPLLQRDTPAPSDLVVVLGAGVIGDCAPNLNAVRRVLLGARLWRQQLAPAIVFTGGSGTNGCPVAEAMARLAREVGIPAGNIHVEASSLSTRENAERSAPLLRALGARRVLLVTDRLHMRRASAAFAHFGFDVRRASVPIYEGHADNVSMLIAGAREGLALAYYRTRGWLRPNAAKGAETVSTPDAPSVHLKNPTGPLVLLGASYAGGWQLKGIAGVPVLNRGVAGQQSHDMLERFDRDVVAQSPRAVVIWGFINDISNSGPDVEATLRRTRQSYAAMIARARDAGIEPIVATEVTMRPPATWRETLAAWAGAALGKQSFQDRVNASVMETNAWLVREASHDRLLTLDFHAVLSESSGRRRKEFAQPDGSHITEAGYSALTRYAMPILERRLSSEKQPGR